MNESGFKQRLIGAAVLVALAVLFLPVILDGKKAQYFEKDLIPKRTEDNEWSEIAASLDAQTVKSAKSSTQQKSVQTDITNSKIELTGKETAFIVQVASFVDTNNARKLVERLKSQHLKAYVSDKKVNRDGKQLNRVLIGPMLLKSEADAVLAQLKENSDLKATIVEYDPIKY